MTDSIRKCRCCNKQLSISRNKNAKYCDNRCARKVQRLSYVNNLPHRVCLSCGKTFQPKRYDRLSACSRECGFVVGKQIQHIKRTGGRVSVSVKRNVVVVLKRERAIYPPRPSCCRRCGSFYYKQNKQQRICTDHCREQGRLQSRRKQKSARRAVIRGAKIEPVDPYKVFERDGWRCQICMVKTPQSKRGSMDDRAPELDHILPLSKGGDHSYANTQCACRKCNGLKGDNAYGQMPLFAT